MRAHKFDIMRSADSAKKRRVGQAHTRGPKSILRRVAKETNVTYKNKERTTQTNQAKIKNFTLNTEILERDAYLVGKKESCFLKSGDRRSRKTRNIEWKRGKQQQTRMRENKAN